MSNFRTRAIAAGLLLWTGVSYADDAPPPDQGAVEGQALPDPEPSQDIDNTPNTTGPIDTRSGVTVGALNVLDGDPVGLLDASNGGYAVDMWVDSPRGDLERLLDGIPIGSNDGTIRDIARRLLLTRSQSPVGAGKRALVSIRVERLLDAGMIGDAAALALQAQLPNDADFARVKANAILLNNDAANACGDATAARLTGDEVFWIELRAYCFAAAGDTAQVDLIDQVLAAQGKTDANYEMLRDDAVQHLNYMPGLISNATALHVFLLKQAGLPVPMELAVQFHLNAAPPVADAAAPSGYVVTPDDVEEASEVFAAKRSPDQVVQRHAALVLGIADALGVPLTERQQAAVAQLAAIQWTGGRPSEDETQKIDEATAVDTRHGEAMLGLIESLDARDVSAMAPDASAYYVRMLRRLGLEAEARAVAARALREYHDVPPPVVSAQ
jgi:hypothetical protein